MAVITGKVTMSSSSNKNSLTLKLMHIKRQINERKTAGINVLEGKHPFLMCCIFNQETNIEMVQLNHS